METTRTKDRIEYKILARKIAELRTKARMSQRALCAAIGKDRQFINSVERGRVYPDFASILDIFKVLGADPGAVINEVVAEAELQS